MKFERMDSSGETSREYAITILLEIVRSECEEVPGFSYLAKKCYLAEKMRNLDLFGFSRDRTSGTSSNFIQREMTAIESFNLARVVKSGDAICRFTKNYCGEMCREYITLCDEQVADRYLMRIADNPDLKEWQKVIDQINKHPSGKDWHTISIAVHLHSHYQSSNASIEDVIANIKRQATNKNVPLPKNVFSNAINLLAELNLYQTSPR